MAPPAVPTRMPTSATGSKAPVSAHLNGRVGGFTYIELLIVVFLLGLLVSLALLSLRAPPPAERLQREAARLYARMDLAREEAVLQVRTFGLQVDADEYRFLEWRNGRWQLLSDDRLLPAHELPEDIRIDVRLDGIEVSLGPADADREEEQRRPQLFFLSSGEILPGFSLRLSAAETDAEFTIAPGEEQWLQLSDSGD